MLEKSLLLNIVSVKKEVRVYCTFTCYGGIISIVVQIVTINMNSTYKLGITTQYERERGEREREMIVIHTVRFTQNTLITDSYYMYNGVVLILTYCYPVRGCTNKQTYTAASMLHIHYYYETQDRKA